MENTTQLNLEIKSFEDKNEKYGEFLGYASVFNVKDVNGDIIRKGAFQKYLNKKIEEGEEKIPMLWSHKQDEPIGYFPINEIKENENGLFVRGVILKNIQLGQEAYNLIKDKVCNKMSIGFITKDYFIDHENETRIINEIDLKEISLVLFPANKFADVTEVKSINLDNLNVCDNLMNKESNEKIIQEKITNKEYNIDDFYLLNKNEKHYGLFIEMKDGEPEINIKAVINFANKDNLEKLSLTKEEDTSLKEKINNVFKLIREKKGDNSFLSPYEVQQNVISNFTIKDCEKLLKKAGLTNAGFKSFFARMNELKNKKEENIDENQENNSPVENEQKTMAPEELKQINENLSELIMLLKK